MASPSTLRAALVLGVVCLAATAGCRRTKVARSGRDAGSTTATRGPVVCVEKPDGCVLCTGKDDPANLIDPDQSRPLVCDPKHDDECVEFCSQVTPECALPWSKTPGCVVDNELEFHRELFNQQAADRPEMQVAGRVENEGGRRLEGARVGVWLWRGPGAVLVPVAQESTGKDGSFRLSLRSGPWSYVLRISHPGRATQILEPLPAGRFERAGGNPRVIRLSPEQLVRGRVVDLATGAPVSAAVVEAIREAEEGLEVAQTSSADDGTFTLGGLEARRYLVRVTKFGWRPFSSRSAVAAPAQRVTLKLVRANVITGEVVDPQGEPEPNAVVAAVLSGAPGVPTPQLFWTADAEGRFQQEHLQAGTYYLWARRGDMFAYPPQRIDLAEGQPAHLRMVLSHRGARVSGRVVLDEGASGEVEVRALSRTPLAFPRNAAAKVDVDGSFSLSGLLPGRYVLGVRSGARTMAITKGQRDVEIPIDTGSAIEVAEPLTVRLQAED